MLPRSVAPLAVSAALAAIGCRSPTQIDVVVTTNVSCSHVTITSLTAGTLGEIERIPATSTTASCSDEYIGSVVLVPSGSDEPLVGFKVVTAINGATAEQCQPDDAGSYGQDCIVARRALHYLPHTPLQVDVLMSGACAGKACDAHSTCVEGTCVPATIGNPTQCEGNGCTEQALGDGGASSPADAGSDAAIDATLSDASVPDATTGDDSGPIEAGKTDSGPKDAGPRLDGAIFGCDLGGLQAGSPWPMNGYCPTRRTKSPLLGPSAPPVLAWTYPATGSLDGIVQSGPALGADGTIYLALKSDVVDAVYSDGGLRWENHATPPLDAGEGFLAQPVLAADETLHVIQHQNGIYATFALDGGRVTESAPSTTLQNQAGMAIVTGGNQYFGDNDGHLVTLNASGAIIGDVAQESDESDRVAVSDRRQVFSAHSDVVGAVVETIDSGAVWSWPFSSSDHVRGLTIARDGTLRAYYQASNSILALQPGEPDAQGALLWQFDFEGGSPGINGIAVDDEGYTYVGSNNDGLLAFDPNGNQVAARLGGTNCLAPILDAADNVYSVCDGVVVSWSRMLAASNWGAGGFDLAGALGLGSSSIETWGINDTLVIGPGGTLYFTIDETPNDASASHIDLLVALAPP